MTEVIKHKFDGRTVKIFPAEDAQRPMVFSSEFDSDGSKILQECAALDCPPFHLVTISDINWDEDLSPWEANRVLGNQNHFTGGAPAYLDWWLSVVIPLTQYELGKSYGEAYISGYSLAGLFALWSLYQTDIFKGAACVSGSLWFPDFKEYALTHPFAMRTQAAMPKAIYLSLGDRESKTKNKILRGNAEIYEILVRHYAEQKIRTIYQNNPGNHFSDVYLRVARGITWLMADEARG